MASKTGKIAILGFGREGKSVLKFLKKPPQFHGADIVVLDKKLDKNYLKNLQQFDLIFRSPGVPYNLPELARARRKGVRFSSATTLFFENSPTKNIIGITGTKGKGTTCTLLYEILKKAGLDAHLAGNIGKSALDILPKLNRNSWVVLELSSFQLQDLKKSPRIAIVLDVFPDHQDAHLSLREYYEAKTGISKYQKHGDKIFFFASSPKSRSIAQESPGKKIAVSETGFGLFGAADLKIPGHHNFKNAIMAATVSKSLGVSNKIILKTIKSFHGIEHRLEFVRTTKMKWPSQPNNPKQYPGILKYLSISFWNDSASTNPHTSAAAIKAFPGQMKILIAGGQDKGLDYAPLAKSLRGPNTPLVVLYGENKRKIAKAISRIKGPALSEARQRRQGSRAKLVDNLRQAVRIAYLKAKSYKLKAVVILFSPGAASFDQFQNYADRGKRFKKIVKELK